MSLLRLLPVIGWAVWHGLVLRHEMDLSVYRVAVCRSEGLTKVAAL